MKNLIRSFSCFTLLSAALSMSAFGDDTHRSTPTATQKKPSTTKKMAVKKAPHTEVHRAVAVQKPTRKSSVFSKRVTVVLDAGHGGHDSGAQARVIGRNGKGKLVEASIALDVTNRTRRILEDRGARVICTTSNSTCKSPQNVKGPLPFHGKETFALNGKTVTADKNGLACRTAIAQRYSNASYFVAIHCDDAAKKASGPMVIFGCKASAFASRVASTFKSAGLNRRCGTALAQSGSKGLRHLFVLNPSKNPIKNSILVECANLNNELDQARVMSPVGREAIALCIADSIMPNSQAFAKVSTPFRALGHLVAQQ